MSFSSVRLGFWLRLRRFVAPLSIAAGAFSSAPGCAETETKTCPSGRVCPVGKHCAAMQDICIVGTCGDLVKNEGEECDDGNVLAGDHCSPSCQDERCGNGRPDPGEVCDEGSLNGTPGHCGSDCLSSGLCGNGVRDDDEECEYCLAPLDEETEGTSSPGAGGSSSSDATSDTGGGEAGSGGRPRNTACRFGYKETAICNGNCTIVRCGDGYTNRAAGEECDDATAKGADTEACNGKGAPPSLACHSSFCGDSYVNAAAREECDTLGGADTSECNGQAAEALACKRSRCGDGYVNTEAREKCDPGVDGDAPACNGPDAAPLGRACQAAVCGDGYANLAAYEECDVLGGGDGAMCNGTLAPTGLRCKLAYCGDGYINQAAKEECDVLGGLDDARCNGTQAGPELQCRAATCGDGYVNHAVETCDPINARGADTAECNGNKAPAGVACHEKTCGDRYVNVTAGEACDEGALDTASCNGAGAKEKACLRATCGDNYVNSEAREECDATGGVDSELCNGKAAESLGAACRNARCGDNYVNAVADEVCDASNGRDTSDCNGKDAPSGVACRTPICGDKYTNQAKGEECDGGEESSDSCNGADAGAFACKKTACGDGYINAKAGETCDDGNKIGNDGCSPTCVKEEGFTCTTPGSACTPACGDGKTVSGEACDDGNNDACGTCSAGCLKVQSASPARGSIVIVKSSQYSGSEYFALSDGVHPPVTFALGNTCPAGHSNCKRLSVTGLSEQNGRAYTVANAINDAIAQLGPALRILSSVQLIPTSQYTFKVVIQLTNASTGALGNIAIQHTLPLLSDSSNPVEGMAGGSGIDCPANTKCRSSDDCLSRNCVQGVCAAATASDGVQNDKETSIDCGGGTAPACGAGATCEKPEDCRSNDCSLSDFTCQPSCTDGEKNQGEEGTDCGGPCSTAC